MSHTTRITAAVVSLIGGSVWALAPLDTSAQHSISVRSTPVTSTVPATPPTDPGLASRIPVIDGYTIVGVPSDDLLWAPLDRSVPGELIRHHALVVAPDGVPVARLVVAAGGVGRPAIDSFVEHTFADDVFLPVGAVSTTGGVLTTMNPAVPIWTEMEGSAVIVAEQATDGNLQWAWGAADSVWIVRGGRDAEGYVRAVLRAHAPALDPYDQQGMTGALFDHTPATPGYQYWDSPRASTLSNLSESGLGDCTERFYLGYILPDGVTAQLVDSNNLWLGLTKAAGRCIEHGLLADVAADIASGRRAEQIGEITVYRDEQFATALVGDVLITLYSADPQSYVDLGPFIDQFFARQPRDVEPDSAGLLPASGSEPPAVPVAVQLIVALGSTLGGALEPSGEGFIAPEATCLDAVVQSLEPDLRAAVDSLIDDPTTFYSLPDDQAEGVVLAYLECIDPASLAHVVSATVTRAFDRSPCIAESWAGSITAERIASSMAYGYGLDDLATDVVDELTLAAGLCVPDAEWWIGDEAQALEQRGFDAATASCVVTAIVDELGIAPIIRRRVLTLPFYPVLSAELERIFVPGRCDFSVGGRPDLGQPGTCLSGFGQTATTEPTPCDQPHNSEVVSVTDLTSQFPTWPGYGLLRETVASRCAADLGALEGDLTGYGAGWDIPNRLAWEQGDRLLTCTLVRQGFAAWTGPSGLVPITPATTVEGA